MFDLMPFDRRGGSLFHYLDNLDKNFWGDLNHSFSEFKTDIMDQGDKFILQAELPGFQKEEIKIDVEGDYLTISAEHREETEEKKDNFVHRERKYGSFARSFNISNIDAARIGASYQNGVLELELPKLTIQPSATRRIDVK